MAETKNSLFYGPVPSRRFGCSLGIDLIPYKICSFDCIYCQLGKTTLKTAERKRYREINLTNFIYELEGIISNTKKIDYLTFSGSGEPTLNSDIGILIDAAKKITDVPVAVLTNGSILSSKDVINDLQNADLVKISFDGCSDSIFKKINRPLDSIAFSAVINGIKLFLKNTKCRIWLEIMILKGMNDDLNAVSAFKKILLQDNDVYDRIEKIHINTPVRPSGYKEVFIPHPGNIQSLKDSIRAKAEIISQVLESDLTLDYYKNNEEVNEKIVELAKRRPVTTRDISIAIGANINEIIKYLRILLKDDKIKYKVYRNSRYYYC